MPEALTCPMLQDVDGSPDSLHRFVIGTDETPQELEKQQIDELGDDLAQLGFAKGTFPRSAGEVLELLKTEPSGRLAKQGSFCVSEEGQMAEQDAEPRFVVILSSAEAQDGPDVFVSAAHPTTASVVEVMVWDHDRTGFNYYQRASSGPWVLAGNSADAFGLGARQGPFESHPSGNVIMKELRLPWVHWNSFAATIRSDVVAQQIRTNPWFFEADGAEALEGSVMASIRRWTSARLDAGITIRQVIEPILRPTTVNLVSSKLESKGILAGAEDDFDIPHAFFMDSETLNGVLDLPAPDPAAFRLKSDAYRATLERHQVALRSDGTAQGTPLTPVPSDTHFAFVVPERAFEDITMVRLAISRGLITKRLAACLLMVDFPNPVFSERRAGLLDHVPGGPATSDVSDTVVEAILASPASTQKGTPEREFRDLWEQGEDWPTECAARLKTYTEGLIAEQAKPDRANKLFALAEQRRDRVRDMPIAERPTLFATPGQPPATNVSAHPDGKIS